MSLPREADVLLKSLMSRETELQAGSPMVKELWGLQMSHHMWSPRAHL